MRMVCITWFVLHQQVHVTMKSTHFNIYVLYRGNVHYYIRLSNYTRQHSLPKYFATAIHGLFPAR